MLKKLQCEDLIGIKIPKITKIQNQKKKTKNETENETKNEALKFEEGFLVKAIKEGNCVIFDKINEASSTVYERLNGLLDKKYNEEDRIFYLPEKSTETLISIHVKFRIICTCNNSKLKDISPFFK